MNIKEMNIHQLEDEINAQEQQIIISSNDYKEIMYLDALYDEANKRGYEIQTYKTIKLIEGRE